MWMHDWNGWWAWVVMPIMMVAFWGIVIWAVLALVRGSEQQRPSRPPGPSPEEILGERFARGEIDETEYEARLATLRGRARTLS